MRILKTVIISSLGAVMMLAVGTSAATAQPSAEPQAAAGWITYQLPDGVNPALTTDRTIQGTPLATGGCRFTYTGITTPGSGGSEQDEVAVNPSTCQAIYAIGPIQGTTLTLAGAGDSLAEGSGVAQSQGDVVATASQTRAYFMKTFYEDPVGIDVTELRQDVEWTYSGGCNQSYKWKRYAHWYTPSGWGLDWVGDKPAFGCNNAISNSHAQMTNEPFCWPESVTTRYAYNHHVDGRPDGSVQYVWNDEVSSSAGICYHLLSHHDAEGYETPW